MKRSTFHLIKSVDTGEESFPSGTMIHPIFDSRYLSKEKQEELIKINSYSQKKRIMCMVGKHWLAIEEDNIKEYR